jgi:hypothetical protein
MSAHVEFPRPYESAPGRFTVDLAFPAASKRRAKQHHDVAWALADVHGVEAATPFKLNPRWSYYKEMCGTDERYGGLDDRRLTVQGDAGAVAGYVVALERVLDEVEALATRAVRVFGAWKRSAAAEPFLEYEDASTMRVRVREFRADVLHALAQRLGARTRPVEARSSSRPLWEQHGAVAEEVWAAVGGVDLEQADDSAVTALRARMVPAVVAEAERLAAAEAARVEAERLEAERVELFEQAHAAVLREVDEVDAVRGALDGQEGLFPVSDARPPLVVPPARPARPRRAPRKRTPVAERFPAGTTHVVFPRALLESWFEPSVSAALVPVSAERRRYAPAA